jgi:predicted ATPase
MSSAAQLWSVERGDAGVETNLLRSAGSLWGRREELAALQARCAGAIKVSLTLVGPPGVGKSRLLEALSWWLLDEVPDREVWWVDLRERAELSGARSAVASLLEASVEDGAAASLSALLEGRAEVWFVLDNAEHMIEAAWALVNELLEAGARGVFVSSRRALGGAGEQVVALDVLKTPEDREDERSVASSEAVGLLMERVRARQPRFAPTGEELIACGRIAALLDGLPLALELVASRLQLYSPSRLLAQLGDKRGRGVLGRRDVLDTALSWSWTLLDEQERDVLARSAVFAQGFELGRAARVLQLSEASLAPILASLEGHSLLVRHDGERWVMWSSVQRWVLGRLDEVARRVARLAHVEEMARYGEEVMARLCGSAWHESVEEALEDRANFASAARYARELGASLEVRVRVWLGLGLVMWRLGEASLHQELEELVREVDEREEEVSARLRALLWRMVLDISSAQWSQELIAARLERALALRGELSAELGVMLRWRELDAHIEVGRREEAWALGEELDEAVDELVGRREIDEQVRAFILSYQRFVRGHLWMLRGEFTKAHDYFTLACEGWPGEEQRYKFGRVRLFRGFACQMLQRPDEALEELEAAREIFEQVGDVVSRAHVLRVFADYCLDESRLEQARQALEELEQLGRYGLSWGWAWSKLLKGQLLIAVGDPASALVELERSARRFEQLERPAFEVAARLHRVAALLLLDAEEANGELEGVWGRRDQLRSPWGRLLASSLRLAQLTWRATRVDGSIHEALRDVEEQAGRGDHALHGLVGELSRWFVEQVSWREALSKRSEREAQRHRAALIEGIARVQSAQRAGQVASHELRLMVRVLIERLPSELKRRLASELEDPRGEALVVDEVEAGYRAPKGASWVELGQQPQQAKLLYLLANQREVAPGVSLTRQQLCEELWPGEAVDEVVQNRFYVLISHMRRDGLRDVLAHDASGYLFDPGIRLVWVRGRER